MTRPFTTLLADMVAPHAADELATLIGRAELGARLVGAIALTAAARSLSPPTAAGMLGRLDRSHLGRWGPITRISIEQLPAGAPLASWRALLSRDPVRDERGLDRWVTDYETALRHAGRPPPASLLALVRDQITAFLTAMCERLAAEVTDLAVDGQGEETVARAAQRQWPTSPFLELDGAAVRLWDSPPDGAWAWLRYRLANPWEPPEMVPPVPAPPARGALLELRTRAAAEPVSGLVGAAEGIPPPAVDDAVAVVAVDDVDLLERADALVERWRGPRRPVLMIGVDGDEVPLERLQVRVTAGDRSARQALAEWRGRHPELETIVVAMVGRPRRVELVDDARRALHGIARVVVITASEHVFGQWSPLQRQRLRIVRDVAADGRPLAVRARLQVARPVEAAWIEAATEVFALDRPESIGDLIALAHGADLLERRGLLALWERGLIAITRDGAARLAHPGWSALACGLAGVSGPPHQDEAWAAGRRLAAERHRG